MRNSHTVPEIEAVKKALRESTFPPKGSLLRAKTDWLLSLQSSPAPWKEGELVVYLDHSYEEHHNYRNKVYRYLDIVLLYNGERDKAHWWFELPSPEKNLYMPFKWDEWFEIVSAEDARNALRSK